MSSELNLPVIFGVIGAMIALALLGLMVVRRSGSTDEEPWNNLTMPSHDSVANSMYGGSQALFQQPMQTLVQQAPAPTPQPTAPVQTYAGPPLPPGGLPAGWTMDQWTYYGQQYLDKLN
jgi:hypothetical protein